MPYLVDTDTMIVFLFINLLKIKGWRFGKLTASSFL